LHTSRQVYAEHAIFTRTAAMDTKCVNTTPRLSLRSQQRCIIIEFTPFLVRGVKISVLYSRILISKIGHINDVIPRTVIKLALHNA